MIVAVACAMSCLLHGSVLPGGRQDYPTDLPGGPEASLLPGDEREMINRDEWPPARSSFRARRKSRPEERRPGMAEATGLTSPHLSNGARPSPRWRSPGRSAIRESPPRSSARAPSRGTTTISGALDDLVFEPAELAEIDRYAV